MIGPLELPAWEEVVRLLTLRDYNTRVVLLGTMLLGAASGLAGTFLLLRKRSLLSDAVSHATLPGVAIAFLFMVLLGGSGKSLPGLLLGAAVTGTIGMLTVLGIRRFTRLKDDAALGIVLSVFFGAGIALLGVVSRMEGGNAAGLEGFIYGKTASMLRQDAMLIGAVAAVCLILCVVLFKEFALLCFDADFAAAQGWPVTLLDILMMTLVVIVTVIGLQAVGLILVVALLIIPAAAARFWTHSLRTSLVFSGVIGGLSGLVGSGLSALIAQLPAGAIIVLVTAFFFGVSMVFGTARGVLPVFLRRRNLQRTVRRQHLLRALLELDEQGGGEAHSEEELLARRSWERPLLRRIIRRAEKDGHARRTSEGTIALTARGREEARDVLRNHRLWEMYLITHADIAPSHVDRDADMIEHILSPEMIAKLEGMLDAEGRSERAVPGSPH